MKKIFLSIAVASVLAVSAAGPAQAAGFRDGEYGYRVGCAFNWFVFGHWGLCRELLR